MPYYRITLVRKDGRIAIGIKEDYLTDIDQYAVKAYRRALAALKNELRYFEVVMVTSNCDEVKKFNEMKLRNSKPTQTGPGTFTGKEKFGHRNLSQYDATVKDISENELQAIKAQLPDTNNYGYPFIEIKHKNIDLRFAKIDVLENGFVTGKFEWKLIS